MSFIWSLIVSFFVWLSADPHLSRDEPPKSAAAVAVAYASLATTEDPE